MSEFDYGTISDEAIRIEYRSIMRRANVMSSAIHRIYGEDRPPINFKYVEADTFNASASLNNEGYLIELNSSVPLFLLILFSRLLSDPRVLPHLSSKEAIVSDFTIPAIIDPSDFNRRADWKISLGPIRSFAAGTLADICATFVISHEIGHVISGHVDAYREIDGALSLNELVSRSTVSAETTQRRQAWELDADATAATLMMNFVDELRNLSKTNDRVRAVFSAGEHTLENILAISIVSLFAFFCYLKGSRDALGLTSSHPHPFVRAYYLRNLMVNAALDRWDFDADVFMKFSDDRLDEFLIVMEDIAIFDPQSFSEETDQAINDEISRLIVFQEKFRPVCTPWSWISWG